VKAAAATIAGSHRAAHAGLTVGTLAAALLGLFALDNLLLLHFWGLPLPLTAGLAVLAGAAITRLSGNFAAGRPRVPLRVFAVAFAFSLALFALGGEGRFFYANVDWQVRDAVLRDLATNAWPLAYDIDGTAYFLRAPLGTYLLPAMFGAHAETALLLSNAVRLALLLTLAWPLFRSGRERLAVLAIVVLFSGWDVVGTALASALGGHPSWDHLEAWNPGSQFSSNVTLAFWVPQHAIAGWTCALAFLLWRRGLAPIGLFAASIPLVAFWSPLAVMGAIPFAVFGAVDVLRRRAFNRSDVALAAIAVAIALPALAYLHIDSEQVGAHLRRTQLLPWLLCMALEVLPFAWPLLRGRASPDIQRPVMLLIVAMLFLMPLVQVGLSADFQMRASIMPLGLLSIAFGEWVYRLSEERPARTAAIAYAAVAITLGAVTPLLEVRRAVVNPASPPPLCSLAGVWNRQDNMIVPYATYFAPVSALPSGLRKMPVTAGRADPHGCWSRDWDLPQGWPRRSQGRTG
jgi:hypothetical protein